MVRLVTTVAKHKAKPVSEVAGPHSFPHIGSFTIDGCGEARPLIILDADYRIVEISRAAAKITKLETGQSMYEFFPNSSAGKIKTTPDLDKVVDFIQIEDREFAYSVVKIDDPISSDQLYELRLNKITLPDSIEKTLRTDFRVTRTELAVLVLLFHRYSVGEVAQKRNISIRTVRKHTESIIRKLGSKSMLDALLKVKDLCMLYSEITNPASAEMQCQASARDWHTYDARSGPFRLNFRVDGNSKLRPLVILNSIEFAARLPEKFYHNAEQLGYCVYTVCRPGFLGTPTVNSVKQQADIVRAWMAEIGIKNAIVLAHCTAVPCAVYLAEYAESVAYSVFANTTLGGRPLPAFLNRSLGMFIEQSLNSKIALSFTKQAVAHWVKSSGAMHFYKTTFGSTKEDVEFVESNAILVDEAVCALLKLDLEALRLELGATFTETGFPFVHGKLNAKAVVVNGASTTDQWRRIAATQAGKLQIDCHNVPAGDIFCGFQSLEKILRLAGISNS